MGHPAAVSVGPNAPLYVTLAGKTSVHFAQLGGSVAKHPVRGSTELLGSPWCPDPVQAEASGDGVHAAAWV